MRGRCSLVVFSCDTLLELLLGTTKLCLTSLRILFLLLLFLLLLLGLFLLLLGLLLIVYSSGRSADTKQRL